MAYYVANSQFIASMRALLAWKGNRHFCKKLLRGIVFIEKDKQEYNVSHWQPATMAIL